jgi:hypothetical protein
LTELALVFTLDKLELLLDLEVFLLDEPRLADGHRSELLVFVSDGLNWISMPIKRRNFDNTSSKFCSTSTPFSSAITSFHDSEYDSNSAQRHYCTNREIIVRKLYRHTLHILRTTAVVNLGSKAIWILPHLWNA